jgi:small GTP-binding protein
MTIRITLIGVTKSGKTLLTQRLAGEAFSNDWYETIGIDFRILNRVVIKNGHEETLKIQLWDTSGAERFASIAKVYTKNSCYFVIDPSEAIEPQIAYLNKFLEQPTFIEAGAFCNIIITKCDLLESIEEKERNARLDKIEAYRQELITTYQLKSELVKTSEKTGTGLKELMQLSINQFLELPNSTHHEPESIIVDDYASKFSHLDTSTNVSQLKQQAQTIFEEELAFAGDNLQKIQDLLTAAKPYLNQHQNHRKDKMFRIHNTNTWQHCVKLARERGLGILTSIATASTEPTETENMLTLWETKSLFASHRGNSFFTGAFGRTKAQKEIEHLHKQVRLKL